jgi:hypothetical protein
MLINCKETFIYNFFEFLFANIMGVLKILTSLTETGVAKKQQLIHTRCARYRIEGNHNDSDPATPPSPRIWAHI